MMELWNDGMNESNYYIIHEHGNELTNEFVHFIERVISPCQWLPK